MGLEFAGTLRRAPEPPTTNPKDPGSVGPNKRASITKLPGVIRELSYARSTRNGTDVGLTF
jgi:hypothetical protein